MAGRSVRPLTVSRLALRLATFAVGGASIAWGIYTLPNFWRDAEIESVYRSVIAGKPFTTEAALSLLPLVREDEQAVPCRPMARQAAATVRLLVAEHAFVDGEAGAIDQRLAALDRSIRLSLGCAPADPYLWLVLFWAENTIDGFSPGHLAYLRMSYRLGPNEGWIALKRNPMAFTVFSQLPPDLADMALAEFAGLVGSDLYDNAADILVGPAWPERELVLQRLKGVDLRRREAFAKVLQARGYDLDVPGVRHHDPRPWHRPSLD